MARIIPKKKKKNHIGEIGWARSESQRGGVELENRRESDGKWRKIKCWCVFHYRGHFGNFDNWGLSIIIGLGWVWVKNN